MAYSLAFFALPKLNVSSAYLVQWNFEVCFSASCQSHHLGLCQVNCFYDGTLIDLSLWSSCRMWSWLQASCSSQALSCMLVNALEHSISCISIEALKHSIFSKLPIAELLVVDLFPKRDFPWSLETLYRLNARGTIFLSLEALWRFEYDLHWISPVSSARISSSSTGLIAGQSYPILVFIGYQFWLNL